MGWVKLDDGFAEDPVIANLSDSAAMLWVAGLGYCNRKLTDGFIPQSVGYGQLRYCGGNAVPYVDELVRAGRWIVVDGGWQVHRYLEWQRSKETILGDREVTKERVSRYRNDGGNADTADVGNAVGNTSKNLEPKPQYFENFYLAYPRHVGRRAAEKAFAAASKRADAKAIIEGASRFAADPNLPETTYVPYPATWLNRDGWEDDALPKRNGHGPGSGPDRTALALRRLQGKDR